MSFRRHTRVRRKSRYAEWLLDAFGSDIIEGWALDEPTGADEFTGFQADKTASINGTIALQQGSIVGGVRGSAKGDGSTGYADAGDDSDFDFGSTESFTALTFFEGPLSGSVEFLLNKRDKSTEEGWVVFFSGSDNKEVATFWDDGTDNTGTITSGIPISDDRPHMAGGVADRSSDTFFTIQDGMRTGSTTDNDIAGLGSGQSLEFFRRSDDVRYVSIKMQYVMLFSRALTESETTTIYEQGAKFFDRGRLL